MKSKRNPNPPTTLKEARALVMHTGRFQTERPNQSARPKLWFEKMPAAQLRTRIAEGCEKHHAEVREAAVNLACRKARQAVGRMSRAEKDELFRRGMARINAGKIRYASKAEFSKATAAVLKQHDELLRKLDD